MTVKDADSAQPAAQPDAAASAASSTMPPGAPPNATAAAPEDFSMVLGGPLYQLFLRLRIVRPPLDLLARRMFVISMLGWLPLFILAIVIHRAWGGAKIPFLYDIATHVRFLIAVPLLIAAELIVHLRLRPLIEQFIARGIVPPHEHERFFEIVRSSFRLRNSILAEVLLLVLVFSGGQAL